MTKIREVEAFPLSWPDGWKRTPAHIQKDGAHFKVGNGWEGYGDSKRYVGKRMISVDYARQQLMDELGRLERLDSFVSRVAGKRLTYKALIA